MAKFVCLRIGSFYTAFLELCSVNMFPAEPGNYADESQMLMRVVKPKQGAQICNNTPHRGAAEMVVC